MKVISGRRSESARPRELTDRFPFLERSNPKRLRKGRATAWKTVPCCLRGPSASQVPSKTEMGRTGLGSLWFTRDEDPLELELITASELHFLILCLYPMLRSTPYQFCRAAGLGNKVIVPLLIDDSSFLPASERPFKPYFSVQMLKDAVGRKGRLYIRPLLEVKGISRLTQLEVCMA